jgi:hypothetical protein
MGSVHLYSDETGQHTRGRFFIVAGVALSAYRQKIRTDLLRIEAESAKGLGDWHGTSPRRRRLYLKAALALPELRDCVFYRVHTNVQPGDYWQSTVNTLLAAATSFRGSREEIVVVHEGFTVATRGKLAKQLRRTAALTSGPGASRCGPRSGLPTRWLAWSHRRDFRRRRRRVLRTCCRIGLGSCSSTL